MLTVGCPVVQARARRASRAVKCNMCIFLLQDLWAKVPRSAHRPRCPLPKLPTTQAAHHPSSGSAHTETALTDPNPLPRA